MSFIKKISKKNYILTFLIGVICLFSLAIFFFIGKPSNDFHFDLDEIPLLKIPGKQLVSEDDNWKSYRNKIFYFQYPASLHINPALIQDNPTENELYITNIPVNTTGRIDTNPVWNDSYKFDPDYIVISVVYDETDLKQKNDLIRLNSNYSRISNDIFDISHKKASVNLYTQVTKIKIGKYNGFMYLKSEERQDGKSDSIITYITATASLIAEENDVKKAIELKMPIGNSRDGMSKNHLKIFEKFLLNFKIL